MKETQLLNAIGQIDDRFVEEMLAPILHYGNRWLWKLTAVAATVAVFVSLFWWCGESKIPATTVTPFLGLRVNAAGYDGVLSEDSDICEIPMMYYNVQNKYCYNEATEMWETVIEDVPLYLEFDLYLEKWTSELQTTAIAEYNGKKVVCNQESLDDHVEINDLLLGNGEYEVSKKFFNVRCWFDVETELKLSVLAKDETVLYSYTLLITPIETTISSEIAGVSENGELTEKSYRIAVLETCELDEYE